LFNFFASVYRKKARLKLCLLVFFVSFEVVDYGGCRGNTAWALAQWRHLVALHEATDALHWAMRPASHRRICMAIKIASV
jgi:hypothetical protein